MKIESFCEALREALVPLFYPAVRLTKDPNCRLLLSSGNWFMGRYVFAVVEWDQELDGKGNLLRIRKLLGNAVFTIPYLVPIGAYVVVCGNEREWGPEFDSLPADRTGLHSVMVQAVHFVDLATGRWDINQSEWGPIRFGGVDSVAPTVNRIVESAPEVDFREA
jgi:hypothetical protein